MIADVAVDGREDGPVASHSHAVAGVETGAQLANDDVAGLHKLPVAALHAAVLGV